MAYPRLAHKVFFMEQPMKNTLVYSMSLVAVFALGHVSARWQSASFIIAVEAAE